MFKIFVFMALFFSGFSFANSQQPPINSFGVELGKPYKNIKYDDYSHNEKINIEPDFPMKDYFQDYSIIVDPENNVFSIMAFGKFNPDKNDCKKSLTYLSGAFNNKYESYNFKIRQDDNGYVFIEKDFAVSITCIQDTLYYSASYSKNFPDFKFKKNVHLNYDKSTL